MQHLNIALENMIEALCGIAPSTAGQSPHQATLSLAPMPHEGRFGKKLSKIHESLAVIQMGVADESVLQSEIEFFEGSSHISPGLAISPFVVRRHLDNGRLAFVAE